VLRTDRNRASSLKLGASAAALLAIVGTGSAALAQDAGTETVVVTGYRASLEKAMDLKRTALDSSDSILAEDIAKFPDMNVSESLQRIPGVALNREAGEGREITVRGLGAQFTRVLINGVEAVATVGSQDVSTSNPGSGAGGTNRGRGFDFNVFASDLFNSLTVHKSNSASGEEGSLGATVDLKTAHPFDHQGFIFTASAQGGYQTLAGSVNPRVATLISNTSKNGMWGVLFSAAYSTSNTLEEGTSSVRWMSDIGNSASTAIPPSGTNNNTISSVAGVTCPASSTQPDPGCAAVNSAFRPRFPRYDIVPTHSKRLGLTGSIQFQPNEHTLFTLDGLFADFSQVRNEYYIEANSLSSGTAVTTPYHDSNFPGTGNNLWVTSMGARNIKVLSYTLGGPTGLDAALNSTNTITHMEATNVGLRNEHRIDHLDTRFMQMTLDGSHEFSEALRVHMLAGWSESHHRNPIQTTLAADYGCINTSSASCVATGGAGTATDHFVYDYSGNMPMLNFGNVDVTSPTGWFLANVRERQEFAYNSYRSAAVDAEYKLSSAITFSGGFDWRNFGFNTLETRRSTGGTGELTTIPDAVRSVPLSTYTTSIGLRGIDVPSGSDTRWFTTDLDKAANSLSAGGIGLWDPSNFPLNAAAGYSNTGTVRENDFSGWTEMDWNTDLLGMDFRGNVGVRYVLTQMSSLGYRLVGTTITPISGGNVYHDWLPTLNAVLAPVEDFQIRFNAGYALSRPNLTGLLPTGSVSVSGTNFTASIGNPKTPPMRSKNLDLAFEWYYGKGSMISVAGFWKHLDNFIQTQQQSGIWSTNPWGYGPEPFVGACGGTGSDWTTITNAQCISAGGQNLSWTFSQSKSVKGAPLWGTEINWQQQLYFLPDPFDNFGLLANYTYVQAQQSYFDSTGRLLMKADLNNMSRNSYNATVYYDDTVFQARLTASARSHYLIDPNIATNYNNYGIWVKGTFNLDASTSYKLNDSIMFTFDALNLTNQASNIYADKFAKRAYQFHKTGQVFYWGVKYNY
jgi:TonB-dependent receptor